MRRDPLKLIAVFALSIIAICAVVATVMIGQIRERTDDLYNVTAKPHCYLSPNDPRRREIERDWGREPTAEGTCDADPDIRRVD